MTKDEYEKIVDEYEKFVDECGTVTLSLNFKNGLRKMVKPGFRDDDIDRVAQRLTVLTEKLGCARSLDMLDKIIISIGGTSTKKMKQMNDFYNSPTDFAMDYLISPLQRSGMSREVAMMVAYYLSNYGEEWLNFYSVMRGN